MSLLANSLYYISLTSLYVNYHKLPHMTLRFALANPDLKNMFFFAFYCTFKKLCSGKKPLFSPCCHSNRWTWKVRQGLLSTAI